MNRIETNLLSLISGNRDRDNGIQIIENKTGLNFKDMLNSRINESENFSHGDEQAFGRIPERNESVVSGNSPDTLQKSRAEENKINGESVRREEDPGKNRVEDSGKEEKAAERSVKELSPGEQEKKASPAEEREGEDIRNKKEMLNELEELGVIIEGVKLENLNNPELNRLLKMLRNMMDSVNPLLENSQLKLQMKNLLSQIKEISENLKLRKNNPALKQAVIQKLKSEIERLNSLIKKAVDEMKNIKPGLKDVLAKINSLVEKIAEKGRGHGAEHAVSQTGARGQAADNTMAVLNKIDTLLSEAVKENGNGSFETGSEREGPNGFSMNFMKNISGKNISGNEARTAANSRFSQQMHSIIENARVFVKDSRNGSFAVKLYPKKLGVVNVNLGLEQGVVNGKFFVENNDARELLMDNLNFIKEQLEEAGINIGSFEVNVNHQGEMFTGEDPEETLFTLPGTGREVAKEYTMSSLFLHDGEFNMVI